MLKKGPKRDQFFEKVPFRDYFPEKGPSCQHWPRYLVLRLGALENPQNDFRQKMAKFALICSEISPYGPKNEKFKNRRI